MYTQRPIVLPENGNSWAKWPTVYTLLIFHHDRATTEGGRMRASDKAYEALRDDIIEWRLRPWRYG